jgi:hypothetical protein
VQSEQQSSDEFAVTEIVCLPMRRFSLSRRIASVLLGCWFVLFSAELPMLHVCAVHDSHAAMGQMPHSPTHHSSHDNTHATCTCPGACCPGVGARLDSAPRILPPRIVAIVEPAPLPPTLLGLAAARVVLPPSLGPPAISG